MNSQRPTSNSQSREATKGTKSLATKNSKITQSLFLVFFVTFVAMNFVTFVAMNFVASVAHAQEKITELRVHGNHTTPDADVLALSGLTPGAEISDAQLKAARKQ